MEALRGELGAYFGTLRWEERDAPYQARIDAKREGRLGGLNADVG